MRVIILLVVLLVTTVSFGQIEDSVIVKTIEKIKNSDAISYNLRLKSFKDNDTIFEKYIYNIGQNNNDTLLGFTLFITKITDKKTIQYIYKDNSYKKISVDDSTIIEYDLKRTPNILNSIKYKLYNENSFIGISEMLKEIKSDTTLQIFSETEIINEKECFFYEIKRYNSNSFGRKTFNIWISKQDFFPVKIITKIEIGTSSDYKQFIIYRDFSNIIYHEKQNDNLIYDIDITTFNKKHYTPIKFPRTLSVNTLAPDWQLADLNNKTIKLSNFKGKYLLIEFWSPKCAGSIATIDSYKELIAEFDIETVSVCFEKNEEITNDAKNKYNIYYPVISLNKKTKKKYLIKGFPVFYLIDKKGKIIYGQYGNLYYFGNMLKGKLLEINKNEKYF